MFEAATRCLGDDVCVVVGEDVVDGGVVVFVRDGVFDQGEEGLEGGWSGLNGGVDCMFIVGFEGFWLRRVVGCGWVVVVEMR